MPAKIFTSSLKFLRLFIFLNFIFLHNPLEAQDLRIMLDLTPQFSWFQTDMPMKVYTKGGVLGYNAGLQFDYFFSRNYAFTSGIKIFHSGGKLAYADTISVLLGNSRISVPGNTLLTYINDYLNIPVGLHLQSVEIGYWRFYFDTGLNALFCINANARIQGDIENKRSCHAEINVFNLALYARMGILYSIGGSTALTAGISYMHGLLDVTKNRVEEPPDRLTFHAPGLRLGIIF